MDGTDELNSQQVELEISSSSPDQHSRELLQSFTHPYMGIGYSSIDFKSLKEKYSLVFELPNHNLHFEDVKIIIGLYIYLLMRPIENKCG